MSDKFETISRSIEAEAVAHRVRIAGEPGEPSQLRPQRPPMTPVFEVRNADVYYGAKHALSNVTTNLNRNIATALIGPSGCGKSTFLRSLNRMNDAVKGFKITGDVL